MPILSRSRFTPGDQAMCSNPEAFYFVPFEIPKLWLAKTALWMPLPDHRIIELGEYWDSEAGCMQPECFEITTPCCLWQGWNNGEGHGKFRLNGKAVYVHRHSWELANAEPLGEFDVVDHLCRNRACWNPAHLDRVTIAVNTNRGCGRFFQFRKANEYRDVA